MLSFVSLDRPLATVPGPVVTALGRIDTARGREELYSNQLPSFLRELALRARIQSITASSALEGVVVKDARRASQIIDGRGTVLRNRSEQELAGYRSALDYLFVDPWRPLNVGLVLHLHRLLYSQTNTPGGSFKDCDNLVIDRSPDGTVEVRFVPVPASETGFFTTELVTRYTDAVETGEHHPVLLVGLFVLDLLTIHPFTDGNGRVVRVLTNALLDDAGYTVGRYVSLEELIATTADAYYAALLASTHGWHDERNDPWPWLTYFVTLLADAYASFERRAVSRPSLGSKQERVRAFVISDAPAVFRISDVRLALPGVSDPTIRLVLQELKREGLVAPDGTGRSAVWRRAVTSR